MQSKQLDAYSIQELFSSVLFIPMNGNKQIGTQVGPIRVKINAAGRPVLCIPCRLQENVPITSFNIEPIGINGIYGTLQQAENTLKTIIKEVEIVINLYNTEGDPYKK